MSTNSANASSVSNPNRWAVLALLGVAQLMVVLDATIVNIALPSAQKSLHFSTDNRQWIITAYALAFGSLLLLGGKLGDLFGRKTTFVIGLAGFAVASAVGGASISFGMLVTVTAMDADGLKAAQTAISNLAPTARVTLRPVWGSQDSAFAAALPCGLFLPSHLRVPESIRNFT